MAVVVNTVKVVERGATLVSGSATVTTSATLITAANSTRRGVMVQNLGLDYVWVGPVGITVGTGIRVAPGQTLSIDKSPTAAVYGIATSGSQSVSFLEERD